MKILAAILGFCLTLCAGLAQAQYLLRASPTFTGSATPLVLRVQQYDEYNVTLTANATINFDRGPGNTGSVFYRLNVCENGTGYFTLTFGAVQSGATVVNRVGAMPINTAPNACETEYWTYRSLSNQYVLEQDTQTSWNGILNPTDPTIGAHNNMFTDNAVVVVNGSQTITSVNNPWTVADVGKSIILIRQQNIAGQAYESFAGTIATFVSANQVTINTIYPDVGETVRGIWATLDDTPLSTNLRTVIGDTTAVRSLNMHIAVPLAISTSWVLQNLTCNLTGTGKFSMNIANIASGPVTGGGIVWFGTTPDVPMIQRLNDQGCDISELDMMPGTFAPPSWCIEDFDNGGLSRAAPNILNKVEDVACGTGGVGGVDQGAGFGSSTMTADHVAGDTSITLTTPPSGVTGLGPYSLVYLLDNGLIRTVADAVTNSTTTLTSATAAFTSLDVGALVTGTNLPPQDRIASVTNGTTVVLGQAAVGTGSGGSLTVTPIGARETAYTASTYVRNANPIVLAAGFGYAHTAVNTTVMWGAGVVNNGFGASLNATSGANNERHQWVHDEVRNGNACFTLGSQNASNPDIEGIDCTNDFVGINLPNGGQINLKSAQLVGTCLERNVAGIVNYWQDGGSVQLGNNDTCGPNGVVGAGSSLQGAHLALVGSMHRENSGSAPTYLTFYLANSNDSLGLNSPPDGTLYDVPGTNSLRDIEIIHQQFVANPATGAAPAAGENFGMLMRSSTGAAKAFIRWLTTDGTGRHFVIADPGRVSENRSVRLYDVENVGEGSGVNNESWKRTLRGVTILNDIPNETDFNGFSNITGIGQFNRLATAPTPQVSFTGATTANKCWTQHAFSINGVLQACSIASGVQCNSTLDATDYVTSSLTLGIPPGADQLHIYRARCAGAACADPGGEAEIEGSPFRIGSAGNGAVVVNTFRDNVDTAPGGACPTVDSTGSVSSNAVADRALDLNGGGHFNSRGGGLPLVGTGTVTAGGTDNAMEVTGGTSPVTVTFNTPFTVKPICTCNDETNALGACKAVPNANGLTTVVTTAATDSFMLLCVGK